jgi:hypothetical protein
LKQRGVDRRAVGKGRVRERQRERDREREREGDRERETGWTGGKEVT